MVEWKKLGEIANLVRGKVISKDYIRDNNGVYPVYSSQTANDGILGCIDSYMFDGVFLTWTTDGAYAGTIFRRKGKFNITNVCGLIDISDKRVIQDFLYYWLSITAKNYVLEGMGNPKLMSNVASNIQIPIPSLAEQERIVGMLDTFTQSIDNLKEQIGQRRKQYEHYRDQLLDLEGKPGVEMKTLGEIASFRKGRINATELTPSTYVSVENLLKDKGGKIDSENIPVQGHWPIYQVKDILLGNIRPYLRKIWFADNCGGTNGDVVVLKVDTNDMPTYIFKVLSSESFFNYYNQTAKGGKMPRGEKKKILEYPIPIPPLSEQQRIVSILDTFEASIGNLEAQLAERQKQYEYYRNKLLSFE